MKRYFCTECGRSVIEVEFENETAFRIDGNVYCFDCGSEYMKHKEEEEEEEQRQAAAAAEKADDAAGSDETAPDPETAEDTGEAPEDEAEEPAGNKCKDEEKAEEEEAEEPADDEEKRETEDKETEKPADEEEKTEEKAASSASSRRRRVEKKKGHSGGSSSRTSARPSSRRQKAASSRSPAAGPEPGSGRSRRITFSERSTEDKLKIIVLALSAVFVVMAIVGAFVKGCGGSGEKRTVIVITEAQKMIDNARKLKKEGTALYHKEDFDGALEKYYAAQKKYEEVLEKVRNEELTEEDKENNLSYEWIDDEYCLLGPLIKSALEMKVRTDARRENINKNR